MPNSPSARIWIAIGDIHDKIDNLAKIPELNKASGIIITGDLTNCGNATAAERIMAIAEQYGLPVLAQPGNMDLAEVNGWLERTGHNLHDHMHELTPELAVFGIGGSNITPFHTPTEFSEEEYGAWLESLWKEAAKYPRQALISHTPPKDTLCDDIGNNVHVGSTAVREFIEKHQPDVCICGHIHEGVGTDHIGKTLVVNPGMLADGGYVILKQENGQVTAELAKVPA